jgi:metal-responsive CopG/Arc/MetJ family transcriptional regulator
MATTAAATTTKMSISLPTELYKRGESERTHRGLSRSEFVAALYREHLHRVDEEARVARYAAAYARQPETDAERVWTDMSIRAVSDEPWSEDARAAG